MTRVQSNGSPETSADMGTSAYRSLATWVISNFKNSYLNEQGLISRHYPPSSRTVFDNFDDVAPFLIYYGESDFLLEQIRRLGEEPFETVLPLDNVIYSYRIDEYLIPS